MLEQIDSQGKRPSHLLPSASDPGCLDTLWSLSLQGNVSRLSAMLSSIRISSDAGEGGDEEEEDEDDVVIDRCVDASNPYVQDANELADGAGRDSDGAEGLGDKDESNLNMGGESKSSEKSSASMSSRSNMNKMNKAVSPPQEPWLVGGVNSKSRRLRWTPL